MSNTYVESEEIEQIAKKLYQSMKWSEMPDIKFLELVADKCSYVGKCSKATGKWQYLIDKDYVIEVWSGFWEAATDKQKEALLYHELMHINCEEDDDSGEIKWKIRKHDIEEFEEVVATYGAWNNSLDKFSLALNNPGKTEAANTVADFSNR